MKNKNNIKIGCLTNPIIDIIKEIRLIKKLGFDFVEIGMEGPEGMPEILIKKKKQIRALLEKFDVPSVAHTPWYTEIGLPHDNIRKAWIKECKKTIRVAYEIGINICGLKSAVFLQKCSFTILNGLKAVVLNYISCNKNCKNEVFKR